MAAKQPSKHRRGEAAIAGCDPFADALQMVLASKRKLQTARGKDRLPAEREHWARLMQIMPYVKPRLNAVDAHVQGDVEFHVTIGGTDG